MAGLIIDKPRVDGTEVEKTEPVGKRLPTKVRSVNHAGLFICMYIYRYICISQEECDELVDATVYGDEAVISTLINDGVDMDAVIYEVC